MLVILYVVRMSNGEEHAILVPPEDMDKSTQWEEFAEYEMGNISCKYKGKVTLNKNHIVSYTKEEMICND